MKRLVFAGAMVAGLALPGMSAAGAIGANPPSSCGVGQPVSVATHVFGGLGHLPIVPATLIQQIHAEVKAAC